MIKETPSPNVTVDIPHAFDKLRDAPHLTEKYKHTEVMGIHIFDAPARTARAISDALDDAFKLHEDHLYPVGTSGFKNPEGRIGSNRFCTMSKTLAKFFSNVVVNKIPGACQVSQYFRAMKYVKGGEHFPHYDSDFQIEDKIVFTKMSLVCYGNNCDTGEIAFIPPGYDDGSTNDWTRQATPEEMVIKIKPRTGRIVVFDHAWCHTVLPFTDPEGERRILRGDVIFYGEARALSTSN